MSRALIALQSHSLRCLKMQADIALQCHYTDNTQLLELSDHIRHYLKRKKSDSWEQDISEKEMPIYHSVLDQLNVSLQ